MSTDGITPASGIQQIGQPAVQPVQQPRQVQQTQQPQQQTQQTQNTTDQTIFQETLQSALPQAATAPVRPDMSPIANQILDDPADEVAEEALRGDDEEKDVVPPQAAAADKGAVDDYPDIDTRLLQHDFFDRPGGSGSRNVDEAIYELQLLRSALMRELDRVDRILQKLTAR